LWHSSTVIAAPNRFIDDGNANVKDPRHPGRSKWKSECDTGRQIFAAPGQAEGAYRLALSVSSLLEDIRRSDAWRHAAARIEPLRSGKTWLRPNARQAITISLVLLVAWWLLLALFYLFPQIDIAAARQFFTSTPCPATSAPGTACGTFALQKNGFLNFIRQILFYLPALSAIGVLISLIHQLSRDHTPRIKTDQAARLTQAMLIGPQLLGAVMTEEFNRARRPRFIDACRVIFVYAPAFLAYRLLLATVRLLSTTGKPRAKPYRISAMAAGVVSMLAGPYVLVNLVLKEISGRPRPRVTDLFGGDMTFMPAGVFGGECHHNCSFVSGEASGAGWLICLLVILPPKWRKRLFIPIVASSLLTGGLRVLYGGHYLSDAMLGWLLSVIVFYATLGAFLYLQVGKRLLAGRAVSISATATET
jgi:lipid A 4'-phosphatase